MSPEPRIQAGGKDPEPAARVDRVQRARTMTEKIPSAIKTLAQLRAAEAECTRCPLYKDATQVVPGEGPSHAKFMLVGEQPGDKEDLAGKPFVGPAGKILDQALEDAGIP